MSTHPIRAARRAQSVAVVVVLLALGLSALPTVRAGPPDAGGDVVSFGMTAPGAGWVLTPDQLFVTQNAGRTWDQVAPDRPTAVFLAAELLPDGHAWLIASDTTLAGRLVQATRSDPSAAWQWQDLVLPSLVPELPVSQVELAPSSAAVAELRLHRTSSSNVERWSEWRTADGGTTWTLVAGDRISPGRAAEDARVFLPGGQAGWQIRRTGSCQTAPAGRACTQELVLLETLDAGGAWHALPLPSDLGGVRSFTVPDTRSAAAGAAAMSGRTAVAIGQGFDKCEVATIEQARTWRWTGPYSAMNLYIGGSKRFCDNFALSRDYLHALYSIGWTFIPTWVGPQAPVECKGLGGISTDFAAARAQGWGEAMAAADVLWQLGLTEPDGSGSIVYYDMESYDTSNGVCNAAVRSFVGGWTDALHARGQLSGVYGLGPTLSLLADLTPPPDAIWAANWLLPYRYRPDASVLGVHGLSDDLWVNHQRLRQYSGGHDETWGSFTLNIDSNVLDGPVALMEAASDTPTPTATSTPTATPTASATPTVTPTATATRPPFTPTSWVYLPLLMR